MVRKRYYAPSLLSFLLFYQCYMFSQDHTEFPHKIQLVALGNAQLRKENDLC